MLDEAGLHRLRRAMLAIEPGGRFVPERALRRAIRLTREQGRFQYRAVHDRAWQINRDQLFALLTPEEFDLSSHEPATELLLLPYPVAQHDQEAGQQLWRDLFHVAVDRRIDAAFATRIEPNILRSWRDLLGPAQWHAIRQVLTEANLIDADDAPDRVWREFTAFALELLQFRPNDWDAFFPGIQPTDEPLRTLIRIVEPDGLYEATRPAGITTDVVAPVEIRSHLSVTAEDSPIDDSGELKQEVQRGNDVRAAVLLHRSGDLAAIKHLNRLVDRLRNVLSFSEHEAADWRRAVRALLPAAAAGGWPCERRLLYELQRACLANERTAYAADLIEWAVTFGRRPIKRPLPRARWVDALRRFRAALRHAHQLPKALCEILAPRIEAAVHVAEANARDDLRPEITSVLDEVGLIPTSQAEKLSREKLVEELLDAACERGFLRIGDLRDAIARNRVKLADLSGPREFIQGDPLLRANGRLPERLDGVYRRGEIYMRLLQRGCSVFFGTRVGRWLTKYIALPFGGAFVIWEGVHHMVEAGDGLVHWLTGWSGTVDGVTLVGGGMAGTLADNPTLESSGISWPGLTVLGLFLLLMLHWPAFRNRIGRLVSFLLIKLPSAIWHSAAVRLLVHNRISRFVRRFLFVPAVVGGLTGTGIFLLTRDWVSVGLVGGGMALFSGAFFRTPLGRRVEDRVDEAAERAWRVLSVNFAFGLLSLILQFFQGVFEAIDRAIYAVDEWLRFREGDSQLSFAFKLLFGAGWFVFTYLFRFAWTLMVEPQINPIKHFPVVTVSHKLLLPLIPSLAKSFNLSEKTMGSIVFGIPGIFGFLVWELKENWKLYGANASKTLRPAVVGSHGEKIRALLRPGFHSGVVPKTFSKLRRAVRFGKAARATKLRHHLEHIAEAVHRFFERDLITYLADSHRWGGLSVHANHPTLTPNRLLLPVTIESQETVISLEERGGWVIASIPSLGVLKDLPALPRAAFADALTGLYKRAGVHLVREQVACMFGPQAYSFDAIPEGLRIPMSDGSERFFDHEDGIELKTPERVHSSSQVIFSETPLTWADWAERWDADAAGKNPTEPLIAGWNLLSPADGA
jgi:hypothetical protein